MKIKTKDSVGADLMYRNGQFMLETDYGRNSGFVDESGMVQLLRECEANNPDRLVERATTQGQIRIRINKVPSKYFGGYGSKDRKMSTIKDAFSESARRAALEAHRRKARTRSQGIKQQSKSGGQKILQYLKPFEIGENTETRTEMKTPYNIDRSVRIYPPDTSGVYLNSSERPIDYGHVSGLLQEKYGPKRGQEMYESMIDKPGSGKGLYFVVGTKIQKEKKAMMKALGKTGDLDRHNYIGLYKLYTEKMNKGGSKTADVRMQGACGGKRKFDGSGKGFGNFGKTSKDGKVVHITTHSSWMGDVEIMDGTHARVRQEGGNWGTPWHINQLPEDIVQALKVKGLIKGNFFVTDNRQSFKGQTLTAIKEGQGSDVAYFFKRKENGNTDAVSGSRLKTARIISRDSKTKDNVLPNGATELVRKRVAPDKEIVLAKWNRGGREEYITWAIYRGDDRSTSHGHYFISFEEASKDFATRDSKIADSLHKGQTLMAIKEGQGVRAGESYTVIGVEQPVNQVTEEGATPSIVYKLQDSSGNVLVISGGEDLFHITEDALSDFDKKQLEMGKEYKIILPTGMGEPLYTNSFNAAKEMAKEYGKGTQVINLKSNQDSVDTFTKGEALKVKIGEIQKNMDAARKMGYSVDQYQKEIDKLQKDTYTGDPLTEKGKKIMGAMKEQYGEKEGESVFYASKNKGTITGVDRKTKDQIVGSIATYNPVSESGVDKSLLGKEVVILGTEGSMVKVKFDSGRIALVHFKDLTFKWDRR